MTQRFITTWDPYKIDPMTNDPIPDDALIVTPDQLEEFADECISRLWAGVYPRDLAEKMVAEFVKELK